MFEEQFRLLVKESVKEVLSDFVFPTPETKRNTDRPRLLTVDQAAEFLNVSSATIRRLTETGELKAVRAFSCLRFAIEDLEAWIGAAKK